VELLRPLLAAVRRTWRATPNLDLPEWVGKAHHSLVADLPAAVVVRDGETEVRAQTVFHTGADDR
jgi:hypothetical protein